MEGKLEKTVTAEITDVRYTGEKALVGVKVTDGKEILFRQAFKLQKGANLDELKKRLKEMLKESYHVRVDTRDILRNKGKPFSLTFSVKGGERD